MKHIKIYEEFMNEAVQQRKLVLYHGVRDKANVDSILKNGFDLTKIKTNWTNDYAVSTMTTPKSVSRFFGRDITILRIEFEGKVGSPSDAHSYASTPQQYTRDIIDSGIDAIMLDGEGARQVFIYNTKAIKRITKM